MKSGCRGSFGKSSGLVALSIVLEWNVTRVLFYLVDLVSATTGTRADRAMEALRHYVESKREVLENSSSEIVDLIADLLHLAARWDEGDDPIDSHEYQPSHSGVEESPAFDQPRVGLAELDVG